jgi:hypothetical protein
MTYKRTNKKKIRKYKTYTIYIPPGTLHNQVEAYLTANLEVDRSKLIRAALELFFQQPKQV